MSYKMLYHYGSSVNLDNVPNKIIEDLITGEVEECIANCIEIKRSGGIMPVGFSIIDYNDSDFNDYTTKTYYLNGLIIDRNNIPKDWLREKLLKDGVNKLVWITDDFCVPFNEETDTVLRIANL